MAYKYRYYRDRLMWRRIAILSAAAIAIAAGFYGLSRVDTPAAEQLVVSDQGGTTQRATTTAPATTTTAPLRATTTTAATAATTTTIVSSRGPLPTTSVPDSSTTSTAAPLYAPPDEPFRGDDTAPVVAIFDIETITLAGAVPSQAARERLTALVRANSKTPATVIDLLTIDPAVSADVGVRVIELNSTRFAAGEPTITMEHGAELQRMVTFMKALPHVTVTVIGHADQHGADDDNLALSRARAEAVVNFIIDQGVERDRLAAIAVGESELLTLEDDEASLALNRRTEFVVYGALVT